MKQGKLYKKSPRSSPKTMSSLYVRATLLEEMEQIAGKKGQSRNEWIAEVLEAAVARERAKEKKG
jgi:metal-responsive CopG/Arc/MetJ family transcriptional regulator